MIAPIFAKEHGDIGTLVLNLFEGNSNHYEVLVKEVARTVHT